MDPVHENQFDNYQHWLAAAAGEMIDLLSVLPTELLLCIFTFLPARDLTRCRQVCARFKQIVDGMSRSDDLWKRHCTVDFNDVYEVARAKARPGLLWFHLYRSLALWSRLSEAQEVRDEFASASDVSEEIRNFEILPDGVLGVHKRGIIMYYDLETLEPFKKGSITGDYLRYAENNEAIVIMSYHLQMYVVRKILDKPHFNTNVTFDNVKSFLLVDNEIYYVNLNDDIYICRFHGMDIHHEPLPRSPEGVMCLGYTDSLHMLTFERNIYTIYGDNLCYTCSLGADSNLLDQLRQFNFLENLDWRVYFQWMYAFSHTVPQGPLREIVTVRAYGDVYFVGSNWGVLRIYYEPYASGEFDLYNSEPIKQYNFMERSDCPVLSMCPIIQVDAIETEKGHTVIVAMPKKIGILNFVHSFKKIVSVAVLPYDDNIAQGKALKDRK